MLDYLRELARVAPRVALEVYGETHEGRPLVVLAVSSAANVARPDTLRASREILLRPGSEPLPADLPAVVWLGYGVHGNEPSSTEAAMAAAYVLAAASDQAVDLRRVVVLIDPLLNPDGRERYVHDFVTRSGAEPDSDPAAAEHFESWPGGRGNHYFLDLNRDWAWATQPETRARIALMRSWDPQVVVDFHEMSSDSTYFFPPPASPVHPSIPDHAVSWLERFGHANAAAFDRHGWPFFVGEQYDLFYPGYGDSYPTLRGGLGMTYEMAGGGGAGRAIRLPDGELLTLADRVARHLTTSLATVRPAVGSARELVTGTADRRRQGPGVAAPAFAWSAEAPEGRALADLLGLHGIEVFQTSGPARLQATALDGSIVQEVRTFAAGSLVVPTAQPLGMLARTLLEREAPMPEGFLARQRERVDENRWPEFYDVTAWSLPLAFNLPVFTFPEAPPGLVPFAPPSPMGEVVHADVGVLAPPAGLATYRFAAGLQRAGIRYRVALESVRAGDRELPAGTLFVPRAGQALGLGTVAELGARAGQELVGARTSLPAEGIPLGSESMLRVRPSRIGLLRGPGLRATGFGSLWHLLDREVDADLTLLDLATLSRLQLSRFDALVLPDGDAYDELDESVGESLETWVRQGGTLIAVEEAARWVAEALSLELVEISSEEDPQDENGEGNGREETRPAGYFVPGAIVATELRSHPLTAGLPSAPPVLFWGDRFYAPSGDPQRDLLRVRAEDPVLAGVAWRAAEERLAGSLLVSRQELAAGQVILFAQDPAFRGFWRGTMPLFLNAALHGPSLVPGGAY